MGLKITVWPHQLSPGWTGNMQWELNRREAAWRVEAGGGRLDRHPRDKPLGCLLMDARHDNWLRDYLASFEAGHSELMRRWDVTLRILWGQQQADLRREADEAWNRCSPWDGRSPWERD